MTTRSFIAASLGWVLASTTMAEAQDCTPKHSFETVESHYLTVATVTYVPASFVDTDGVLKGIDGDIITEIAKVECLTVKPVPVDVAVTIQSVISRKADVAVGSWYRTAKRAEVVGMSNPLYLDQMVIISKAGYQSVGDLQGKKVGTISGTVWADDAKNVLGDNLTVYPNEVATVQDLAAGRTDAIITGGGAAVTDIQSAKLEGYQVKVFEPDDRIPPSKNAAQTTFPLGKENTGLLNAINDDLKELQASGKIREILTKYGIDPSAADVGAPRVIQ